VKSLITSVAPPLVVRLAPEPTSAVVVAEPIPLTCKVPPTIEIAEGVPNGLPLDKAVPIRLPALTVKVPVIVFVLDGVSVHVPGPCLVRLPEPMAMFPVSVAVPEPCRVSGRFVAVMPPLKDKAPAPVASNTPEVELMLMTRFEEFADALL